MRLLGRRRRVDRARQEADHGVDDDERGELPAGQHVVADGQLEVDHGADPLVDSLVAGADEDEVRGLGQGLRPGVAERLPGRVQEDHGRAGGGLGERRCHRFGAEDHPGSTAVRVVVDAAVLAEAPVAQVVDPDLGEALRVDPAGDALRQRRLDHAREQGEDVDFEGHGSAGSAGRIGGGLRAQVPAAATRGRRRGAFWARGALGGRAGFAGSSARRVDVHHDLAAGRGEDPDECAHDRQVELAIRLAADDEDLGAAHPVDVVRRRRSGHPGGRFTVAPTTWCQ